MPGNRFERAVSRIGSGFPWKSTAIAIANVTAFFSAALTVVVAAWNALSSNFENDQTPIERYVLYCLLSGALAYYIFRANRNERSARYRRALAGIHMFQHRIRDIHEIVSANSDCLTSGCSHERLDKIEAELRQGLVQALAEVKSTFEIVSGVPVRVCIKYVGRSELDSNRLVARTLVRDPHSADQMREVDRVLRQKDLDEIQRNKHFDVLVNATNGRWHLLYGSKLELEEDMKILDARRAFDELGMTVRIESMLLASISMRTYAAQRASSKVLAVETGLTHTSDTERNVNRHHEASSNATNREIDVAPKTIGIIYVDTEHKSSFRRSDVELLFSFADSLFWPLQYYLRIANNKT